MVAMSSDDLKTVEMLIDAGADLNIVVDRDIPLNRAISQLIRLSPEALYILDKMLSKGAVVNPKTEILMHTPLSIAVIEGRDDIFHKLISHGADINNTSSTITPLISAIIS